MTAKEAIAYMRARVRIASPNNRPHYLGIGMGTSFGSPPTWRASIHQIDKQTGRFMYYSGESQDLKEAAAVAVTNWLRDKQDK